MQGEISNYNNTYYLENDSWGIQVFYLGNNKKGKFFLYPYLDDTKKSIQYFAFDTPEQKLLFENALKISGVGAKTAFQISNIPLDTIQDAIQNLDYKVFEQIKGIGPKSAKKILFEMKGSIKIEEYQKLDIDEKLYKQIINTLKTLGYDKDTLKEHLNTYPEKITKENREEVIKRLIKKL